MSRQMVDKAIVVAAEPMTEQQLIAMLTTGRAERRDFCNHFSQGSSPGASMSAA